MTTVMIREQLQKQIDILPDDIVEQIADFTLFMMARRQIKPAYSEWQENQWRTFTLEQFFRRDFNDEQEDEEVEYSLEDAKEVYYS